MCFWCPKTYDFVASSQDVLIVLDLSPTVSSVDLDEGRFRAPSIPRP